MKTFRPYLPDQPLVLPPNIRDWLPEGHLSFFISDVVDTLDLSAIRNVYDLGDARGQPPYHPAMMVKLLLYAYCTGKPSSRRIAKATWEEIPYRVLTADQHPDHDTIASFRKRHLKVLARLFCQVLLLCKQAGLVTLGHVSVDGSKVKANASKHKAMSYDRMCETEKRLEEEMTKLLETAEQTDAADDAEYGKGRRGDELPAELARRQSRLEKIREAKAALEKEAWERAARKSEEALAKIEERERKERETGAKAKGRPPVVTDPEEAKPEAKAQKNFTDPESRIMKDGASKSYEQAYNAQIVVDSHSQIIVVAAVTQDANDKKQLAPMLGRVEKNVGEKPEKASADSGYFSEASLVDEKVAGIDLYVAVDRQKHGAAESPPVCVPCGSPGETAADDSSGSASDRTGADEGGSASTGPRVVDEPHNGSESSSSTKTTEKGETTPCVESNRDISHANGQDSTGRTGETPAGAGTESSGTEQQTSCPPSSAGTLSVKEQMKAKLRTPEGKAVYKMRKAIVEPVFGQIKEIRGFRRFSFRGLELVEDEWSLICLTHNLLKLFRSGWRAVAAAVAEAASPNADSTASATVGV